MQRCLTLAQKGLGNTYPNPMVGSVVVSNGKIIGEGWHKKAGTPHAEVVALKGLSPKELESATLYVNLEPCSHHGKTPPCADLVINSGIKKVVVGTKDPNPKVAGKGIEAMQKAGIEVVLGVLEDHCKELNKRFYCFHINKRPYIILKWAQSLDGFVAPEKNKKGETYWISNIHSQQLAHRWRAEEHSILVGRKTIDQDDSQLTTRKWSGKNPIRIVIDPKNTIQQNAKVLDNSAETIIFNTTKTKIKGNLRWEKVAIENTINAILHFAKENQIQSILVEGGTKTISCFFEQNLWDECRVFVGISNLKRGVKAPKIPTGDSIKKAVVGDCLQIITNTKINAYKQ